MCNLITCLKISKRPAGLKNDRQDRLTSLKEKEDYVKHIFAWSDLKYIQ
jgi:hypothetical protein